MFGISCSSLPILASDLGLKDNNIAMARGSAILEYQLKSTHEEQRKSTKAQPIRLSRAAQLQLVALALGVLLTLFVAFEVYGPALNGEFLFDDSYLPFMTSQLPRVH